MELRSEVTPTVRSFSFMEQDWAQTPLAVPADVSALQVEMRCLHAEMGRLHKRVETLEARLKQHSTTSSKPPSSDAPYQKPRRRTGSKGSRKGGGKPGVVDQAKGLQELYHHGQGLMDHVVPDAVAEVTPVILAGDGVGVHTGPCSAATSLIVLVHIAAKWC